MISTLLSLYLLSSPPQPRHTDGLFVAGIIALVGGLVVYERHKCKQTRKPGEDSPQASRQTNGVVVESVREIRQQPITDSTIIPERNKVNTDIQELLGRIAREDGSTALCGDPGTGKSTITREYIKQVKESNSRAIIKVLAVKNDSFCGLRESGNVTQFDEDEIDVALSFFKQVKIEYNRRRKLTEDKREGLSPYVIILDDWISISSTLIKWQNKQSRKKISPDELPQEDINFGSILYNILTIGREYNMKFFVNLHSLNLKAIGIEDMDANSRSMLKVLILGNRYIKHGRELDAYGIIERAITGNQVITDLKIKEDIRKQYYSKKEESRSNCQPICFAFIGEYYVGLVPRFNETDNQESANTIKGSTDLELTEPIEPQESSNDLEPTLEEEFSVIKLRREGKNKKDIIYQIWGAKKGGGKSYQLANFKYEKIIEKLNQRG